MSDLLTQSSAIISPCSKYRYQLTRRWDAGAFLLPIIMLNPSTADAELDDPTIRRCMSFAKRDRFGGIRVMNLFAYRATSPEDMKAATDPIGPECSTHLERMLASAADNHVPVLAAWGANGDFMGRAEMVMLSAKGRGVRMACLGTTKQGHPRHPLYVRGDQPFESYLLLQTD